MKRAIGIFLSAAAVFVVCVLLAFGVVEPLLEAWQAWVVVSTGSAFAGDIAMILPFAAFFGFVVAATA